MSPASPTSEASEVQLKDLRVGTPPVRILARVVSVDRRQVTRRSDGARRWVLSGLLSDGTATVRFTWWDPPAEGVERGLVLRAVNVLVREFRGTPELSIGWNSRVEPASEQELPSLNPEQLPLRGLADLAPRDEGFRLECRVAEVSARTVTVGTEQRVVYSGQLADGTGRLRFSAWVDFRLQPGEAVRIVGAYVRSFRGRPELTLDQRSHVERISGVALPAVSALAPVSIRGLGAVAASGGGEEVLVEGLVLALVSPSGVVSRCPNCQRVLQKGLCRLHGAREGVADLRARVVVDDGTGVATANLGREATEQISGRTLDGFLARLHQQPDPGALEEELRAELFGRRIRIRGSARVDDFGVSMFPSEIVLLTAEPDRTRAALEERLAKARA